MLPSCPGPPHREKEKAGKNGTKAPQHSLHYPPSRKRGGGIADDTERGTKRGRRPAMQTIIRLYFAGRDDHCRFPFLTVPPPRPPQSPRGDPAMRQNRLANRKSRDYLQPGFFCPACALAGEKRLKIPWITPLQKRGLLN